MEGNILHYSRIVGLVGVVVAAIGLLMQSATSLAEDAVPGGDGMTHMEVANTATGGVAPSEFDSVWGAIYNELTVAGIILVLALVVIVALAFVPPMKETPNRMYSLVGVIVGVIVIVIAGIAMNRAMGDATDLQAAYAQLAAVGALPAAFGVSITVGWVVLLVGGGVSAVGSILGLMANTDDEEATAGASGDE